MLARVAWFLIEVVVVVVREGEANSVRKSDEAFNCAAPRRQDQQVNMRSCAEVEDYPTGEKINEEF